MSKGSPRRIVLVHRYFAPDTPPYANMLAAIAAALAEAGHDVTVLTCQPSYNRAVVARAPRSEYVDGYRIRRFPVLDDRTSHGRKILNLGWFCLRVLASPRTFRRADVVMAATTPPVLVALVCSLVARRRGCAFIYHKQDIYPEVAGDPGSVSRRALTLLLSEVDRRTDRRADRVVVLSDDMARTTLRRWSRPDGLERRVEVLNNFDPWSLGHDDAVVQVRRPSGLTLVFAGNLGRFQGLETVVDLIEATGDVPGLQWHFFGDGPLRPTIEGLNLGERVVVYGYRDPDEVARFVRERADFGIVSLAPGVIASAYPSKTLTYLRNGCPILAIVERDSELATMVRAERIGLVSGQNDVAGLAHQLRAAARHPELLAGSHERALAVYRDRFEMSQQLARWVEVLAGEGVEVSPS